MAKNTITDFTSKVAIFLKQIGVAKLKVCNYMQVNIELYVKNWV